MKHVSCHEAVGDSATGINAPMLVITSPQHAESIASDPPEWPVVWQTPEEASGDPTTAHKQLLGWATKLKHGRISSVAPLVDTAAFLADHINYFADKCSSERVLQSARLLDKSWVRDRMVDATLSNNIAYVRIPMSEGALESLSSAGHLADEVSKRVGWPAFAKPIRSSLSSGAGLVVSPQVLKNRIKQLAANAARHMDRRTVELESSVHVLLQHAPHDPFIFEACCIVRSLGDYLVEEKIPTGKQTTVDMVVDHSGFARILGTSDSHMFEGTDAFSSFTFPAEINHRELVEKAAIEAAGLLNIRGRAINLEFRIVDDKVYLVEVNPRPSALYRIPYLLLGYGDLLESYLPVNGRNARLNKPKGRERIWDCISIELIRTRNPAQVAEHPSQQALNELRRRRPNSLYMPIATSGRMVSETSNPEGSFVIGAFLLPRHKDEAQDHVLNEALRVSGLNASLVL